ncbi:hypothetical protein CERZMDRAFT_97926 [Cercospora zeae-maydis SCOH1-5]|uniref:Spindle pole body-associated protein cut12 domain-containing protein n=1 Tax=Cercospora zeae-maydis SCOH1-5 TaxID=717836 RepID=A0A6A6FFJ2_9PEZI|nr:hypothetical protein CERZMDRAFT_97926 [Cercospora zeae-maydis SCOH1-5]
MLHWLAGQKTHESSGDPDTTTSLDPPETPAPIFAVRAFKHAIFGTPATEKPKAPRRHSNTENARNGQPSRPRMMRPRSTNDAHAVATLDEAIVPEPLPSPTKGILMTPGTVGGKRKTVTFPDHVVDNEHKRPTKTGLPEDCPGKFPSPWTKAEHIEDSTPRSGGRSKLTEALEQAREDGSRRKARLGKAEKSQEDLTADLAEPVSDSGKYWKREYDIYREKTTAEVKKLVAKQRLAKSYAKDKDDECLDLRDELVQERRMVDKLQKRTVDLEARLREYQELLQQSKAAEASAMDELERIKRGFSAAGYRRPVETASNLGLASKTEIERRPWHSSRPTATTVDTASGNDRLVSDKPEIIPSEQPDTTRPRRRPRETQKKTQDDIWAPSSTSERPQSDAASRLSRGNRAVTSGTGVTPLQSLSINTVPKDPVSLAMSTGLKPPASPTREDKRQDSPLQQDNGIAVDAAPPPPPPNDDISIIVPSSPFDPDATMTKRQPPSPTVERSFRKELRRTTAALNTKENVSPTGRPKSKDGPGGAEKPSAAWTAMSAPVLASTGANVNATAAEKENEKRQRALEKARERLAARGRIVS